MQADLSPTSELPISTDSRVIILNAEVMLISFILYKKGSPNKNRHICTFHGTSSHKHDFKSPIQCLGLL
jgi:hypothetical protein